MYYGQGQRGHRYHVFDEVRPLKGNVILSVIFMMRSPCITGFPDVKVVPPVVCLFVFFAFRTEITDCVELARTSRKPLCINILEVWFKIHGG